MPSIAETLFCLFESHLYICNYEAFFFDSESHHETFPGVELTHRYSPASASQSAGIKGVHHHASSAALESIRSC